MSLLTRACSSLPRDRQRPLSPAVSSLMKMSSLAKMPALEVIAALETTPARRWNSVTAKRNLVEQK